MALLCFGILQVGNLLSNVYEYPTKLFDLIHIKKSLIVYSEINCLST